MNLCAIGRILILLAVANGAPVVAKRIWGPRMAWPVDGGARFWDGRRIFGCSKTVRGIAASLVTTAAAAHFLGMPWGSGAVFAALAMVGDLFSSFLKRRMGRAPSARATGLDQGPESILPTLYAAAVMKLTLWDGVAAVAVFFAGALLLSKILYALNIRDQPY